MLRINVEVTITYIQSIKWNWTTSFNDCDPNLSIRDTITIRLLLTFNGVFNPRLLDKLPNHYIKLAPSKKIFCNLLKTHLFKLAYLQYLSIYLYVYIYIYIYIYPQTTTMTTNTRTTRTIKTIKR